MIFQEGGHWRSEPSTEENNKDLDDIIAKLTPEEYTALEALLGEYQTGGQSEIADTIAQSQWEEIPIPIEKWLDSYEHVGDTGETIFPVLKKDIIELFSGNYHEVILCLHPDTRIPLLNGTTSTIKELSDRWKENPEPFWVYSYINGEIGPARAIEPRQTGIDDYYRVTLEDGSSFTGNSRHQMIMRDGTKRMIQDMKIGDELIAINWEDIRPVVGVENHYVTKIEKIGNGPVYCMTVPDAGNFAISTWADIQISNDENRPGREEAYPTLRAGVFSSNTGSI